MTTTNARILPISVAAAALILTACSGGDDAAGDDPAAATGLEGCADEPNTCNAGERADGGTMTWIVDQTPDAWFSISVAGGSVYTLQMNHGILPYTGQWLPDTTYEFNMDLLAAEPEVIQEEPLTAEFYISEDAVWNDGTPITAADFEIVWKMSASEPEGHCVGCDSRDSGDFDAIESIEGSDDGKTVTITWKEGRSTPEWFGFGGPHDIAGGLAPHHIGEEQGFDLDTPEGVGEYFEFLHSELQTWSGGPYILAEGDLDNQVIKEPNPNWYGEEQPTLDTLVMQFNPEASTWVGAISNGEIHGGSPAAFEPDVITQLEQMDGVEVAMINGPSWSHLDVNVENLQLADAELRRAMFTAINAEDISERIWGTAFPDYRAKKNHIFDEESPYFVDHLTDTGQGSGDAARALEILEDAGYEFDGTTLTLDGEQIGPFRLRYGSTAANDTSTELIQSYLAEIGITVNLEPTDTLGETLASQDYDLMQFGWSGSPFFSGSAAQFWDSESGSNFGGYSNPEVDELVRMARSAATQDEAAEFANQAYELVVGDAYVLPLYETPVFLMATDSYVNVRDNGNQSLRAHYGIESWGVAATE